MNRTMQLTHNFVDAAYVKFAKLRYNIERDANSDIKKAFVFGMIVAAGASYAQSVNVGGSGSGTIGAPPEITGGVNEPLNKITGFACTIVNWLRGPIAVALIIGMIVIAGLSMATGGKKASSTLIAALIGAVIVFGARAMANMVTGQTLGGCDK